MGAQSSAFDESCTAVEHGAQSTSKSSCTREAAARQTRRGFGQMLRSPESVALLHAAGTGDGRGVRGALGRHADPNCCNADGLTALMLAAAGGFNEVVELLLLGGGKANGGPSKHGLSALGLAAARGSDEIVRQLLAWSASVSESSSWSAPPLTAAAAAGHLGVCKLLMEATAHLDHTDRRGATAAMAAADRSRRDVLRLFIDWSADVARVDRCGRSVLSRAVDALLALPPAPAPSVHAAVTLASMWRDLCSLMVKHAADVDVIDSTGDSLLVKAVRRRRPDIVSMLLDLGAACNLPVPSLRCGTALLLAAGTGCRDICVLLAVRLAQLSSTNPDGQSALACAVERGDEPLARFLLDNGATAPSAMLAVEAASKGCGLVLYQKLLAAAGGVKAVDDYIEHDGNIQGSGYEVDEDLDETYRGPTRNRPKQTRSQRVVILHLQFKIAHCRKHCGMFWPLGPVVLGLATAIIAYMMS